MAATSSTGIGAPLPRAEDRRLLTGEGHYSDDISRPDQVYVAMVRSPHAHAELFGIDTAAAKTMPGVLAVLTGDDWRNDDLGPPGKPEGRGAEERRRLGAVLYAALAGGDRPHPARRGNRCHCRRRNGCAGTRGGRGRRYRLQDPARGCRPRCRAGRRRAAAVGRSAGQSQSARREGKQGRHRPGLPQCRDNGVVRKLEPADHRRADGAARRAGRI